MSAPRALGVLLACVALLAPSRALALGPFGIGAVPYNPGATTVLSATDVGTSGGQSIVAGGNFARGAMVSLGCGIGDATATRLSSTVLDTTVPATSAGTCNVTAANASGARTTLVNGLHVVSSDDPEGIFGDALFAFYPVTNNCTSIAEVTGQFALPLVAVGSPTFNAADLNYPAGGGHPSCTTDGATSYFSSATGTVLTALSGYYLIGVVTNLAAGSNSSFANVFPSVGSQVQVSSAYTGTGIFAAQSNTVHAIWGTATGIPLGLVGGIAWTSPGATASITAQISLAGGTLVAAGPATFASPLSALSITVGQSSAGANLSQQSFVEYGALSRAPTQAEVNRYQAYAVAKYGIGAPTVSSISAITGGTLGTPFTIAGNNIDSAATFSASIGTISCGIPTGGVGGVLNTSVACSTTYAYAGGDNPTITVTNANGKTGTGTLTVNAFAVSLVTTIPQNTAWSFRASANNIALDAGVTCADAGTWATVYVGGTNDAGVGGSWIEAANDAGVGPGSYTCTVTNPGASSGAQGTLIVVTSKPGTIDTTCDPMNVVGVSVVEWCDSTSVVLGAGADGGINAIASCNDLSGMNQPLTQSIAARRFGVISSDPTFDGGPSMTTDGGSNVSMSSNTFNLIDNSSAPPDLVLLIVLQNTPSGFQRFWSYNYSNSQYGGLIVDTTDRMYNFNLNYVGITAKTVAFNWAGWMTGDAGASPNVSLNNGTAEAGAPSAGTTLVSGSQLSLGSTGAIGKVRVAVVGNNVAAFLARKADWERCTQLRYGTQ